MCTRVTERRFVTSGTRHRHAWVPTDAVAHLGPVDERSHCLVLSIAFAYFGFKMPICAIFGCRSRSKSSPKSTNREQGVGMFSLPKVITRHCERTLQLSVKRRRVWLARINRNDLKNLDNIRVCGRHFVTGECYLNKQRLFTVITCAPFATPGRLGLRAVHCMRLRALCFHFLNVLLVT